MGQYKVPQNVETEDKILGPLSIKQFIYLIIAVLWAFLMWRLFTWFLPLAVLLALPVSGFLVLLAFGSREGVPFEDYVVAFIRFLTLPRKLEWQKDDSKEMVVKDTKLKVAPEVQAKNVTKGQLKQLAAIIDTRGGVKDPSIQLQEENNLDVVNASRVIGVQTGGSNTSVKTVDNQFATGADDILDESGSRSQDVNQLLQTAEANVKQQAASVVQTAIANPSAAPPVQAAPPSPEAYVIAQKANNLPVTSVAKRANEQQLSPGQPVQLRGN
jgi:hypothetical protein